MHQNFTQHLSQALLVATIYLPIFGFGSAMAQGASPNWQVHLPASSLTFNTTKSGAVGIGGVTETMRFKSFKGGMDAQGNIQLDINLASIDSGVMIRDERLQTILWNVATHPVVSFKAKIKPEDLQKINAGKESVGITVDGQLSMASQSKAIKAELQVTPVHNKRMVSTRQAIIINANDFGLNSGVETLRVIMGLSYLSTSAPVTFQLELTPSQAEFPPSAL
jgi:polyisoprenoid-binding protein YceI